MMKESPASRVDHSRCLDCGEERAAHHEDASCCPGVSALRKRVEELNRSNAAHRREHHAALDRAEKAEADLRDFREEVASVFRKHGLAAGPRAVDALVERAEKAEAQLQEAELRYAREFATRVDFQERAEKAERMYDNTRGVLNYIASELSRHLGITGTPTELVASVGELMAAGNLYKADRDAYKSDCKALQADLDAALNWIEHDEDESIPPAGLWQRVKALLEKRRVERG